VPERDFSLWVLKYGLIAAALFAALAFGVIELLVRL